MAAFAGRHGKKVRPHCKTHKCARLAARQLRCPNTAGVCVATVSELEALVLGRLEQSRDGEGFAFEDGPSVTKIELEKLAADELEDRQLLRTAPILLTGAQVTPGKIERFLDVHKVNPNAMVCVDSVEGARLLSDAASRRGVVVGVIVDVDGGQVRTGTTFANAHALARFTNSEQAAGLKFLGIQVYVGHLQHIHTLSERRHQSLGAMSRGAALVRDLREDGVEVGVFTGTGTGTFRFDVEIEELTDMQVGSYSVGDQEYFDIEWPEDGPQLLNQRTAMRMVSTVVNNQHPNRCTIDAGSKAMYKDGPGPVVVSPEEFARSAYEWAGDEHGFLIFEEGDLPNGGPPAVGTVVEMRVSHCDPTINLHDVFFVSNSQGKVVDVWSIDGRGCTI